MTPEQTSLSLGSRVSEYGSYRCGTIIEDWGDSCLVEYDEGRSSRRGGELKRTEYSFKKRLYPTNYYNECWNAWGMQKRGIPSVAPDWIGAW